MTKNTENKENTNFRSLTFKLINSEAENQQLRKDNQLLSDELTYFKEYAADLEEEVSKLKARCRELSRENHGLRSENADMKFTRKYLTSEEAGKMFARELLGKPMTPADIAEETAIAKGEAHYERFAFLGDDF